jgi:hypothetical protein
MKYVICSIAQIMSWRNLGIAFALGTTVFRGCGKML